MSAYVEISLCCVVEWQLTMLIGHIYVHRTLLIEKYFVSALASDTNLYFQPLD